MTEHEPAEEIGQDAAAMPAQDGGALGPEQQLAEEHAKAERYLANWQRAQADFVNYKRRIESEREEIGRFAMASLVISLLPIMDDLERALASVDTRLAGLTWIDGIRLIHRKFQALMEAAGVREIAAEGQMFDPNVHEAVTYDEGEEGRIVRELQRGYRLGDRVIRPSMVVVGKGGVATGGGAADQGDG
ncbi:MAG: nucleotide exchange factor GrpE [Dehalococcoidia bacterium]|nr:nucleotide exchange factor GrpE [Dehalococcoidia bacterium]